ncbi:hypothetical protein B0T21DRAFT_45713 [Apiosordaria backusii]|uniref:Uncharacterized protein n=1 Tax=Apiosordaria backusii TaxID=314023 RepID=A0AA40E3P8_9PEZI|nr:hypothetical protein B0T21DRAFT_45713 [Apiosordaria backusii]
MAEMLDVVDRTEIDLKTSGYISAMAIVFEVTSIKKEPVSAKMEVGIEVGSCGPGIVTWVVITAAPLPSEPLSHSNCSPIPKPTLFVSALVQPLARANKDKERKREARHLSKGPAFKSCRYPGQTLLVPNNPMEHHPTRQEVPTIWGN